MKVRYSYFFLPVFISVSSAFALTQTSVTFTFNGRYTTRDVFCDGKTPGNVRRGNFTSVNSQIRAIRKATPKSTRIPFLLALLKKANRSCSLSFQPNPVGSSVPVPTNPPTPTSQQPSLPTAVPTVMPSATPLPTSPPAQGNFDTAGNTTDKGNVTFQIPPNLTGNVTRGKNVATSFCSGCHVERVNRTYPDIDQAIRKSPMLYDENSISRQQLADLIAYLNRFKL